MLTRTGLGVLIGTVVCAFFGLVWSYEELLALAAAGAIAVALALYTSRRPTRHTARRRLITARVARGETVHVRYQIFNQTQRRLGSTRLTDQFQGRQQSFDVPTLPRMTRHEADAEFPTRRRGIFPIGPLSFERTDQLGLATASRPLGQIGTVVVHPRVYPLITASGAVRVITNDAVLRRPSGDPQSGFQSLREYQYGDDTRLIHWPTSARAATLMVREFVDLRRHEFTVVIDTSTEVATEDDFEEIVDAGASVAAFALRSGLDVVVRTTSRLRAGRPYPLVDQSEMLDLLTPLEAGQRHRCAVGRQPVHRRPRRCCRAGDHRSEGAVDDLLPRRSDQRCPSRGRCRDRRSRLPGHRRQRCGAVRRTVGAVELTPGPVSPTGVASFAPSPCWCSRSACALSAARVVGTRLEPILLVPAVLAVLVGWLLSRISIVARVAGQAVAFVGSGLFVAYAAGRNVCRPSRGLLDGPRQIVTTAWPSPRFPTIFVALAALIFVATAVSIDLAMRVRWRALAIAPMVVAMVAIIAVGAPDGPQWQAVLFAVVASFVLLWIGLDDRVASIRSGLIVAVTVGLAALLTTVGVSVAVADRANPRHGAAADSELSLLDPLAEVSGQRDATPVVDLYDVESPSLGQLHRWRMAALDVYNGESWSTTGRLAPTGSRLASATGAKQATVDVTALRDDTELWVAPGRILRSSSPVETDSQRRVVRIIGTDRPAVTTFIVEPMTEFDPATAGAMATIQPTEIENSYTTLANSMARPAPSPKRWPSWQPPCTTATRSTRKHRVACRRIWSTASCRTPRSATSNSSSPASSCWPAALESTLELPPAIRSTSPVVPA